MTKIKYEGLNSAVKKRDMMAEGERERFLKAYSNLPLNLRKEIILVLDDRGPITWDVAYIEVTNKTPVGETILKKLSELKII